MAAVLELEQDLVQASEAEKAAIQQLEVLLAQSMPEDVHARLAGPKGESVPIPLSVYSLLRRVVHELAQGHAVTLMPIEKELTTQQAADLLNVSRPFLVKVLESGQIPFHTVGKHRRLYLADLLEYRRRRSQGRRAFFARASNEAQNMGIYD